MSVMSFGHPSVAMTQLIGDDALTRALHRAEYDMTDRLEMPSPGAGTLGARLRLRSSEVQFWSLRC